MIAFNYAQMRRLIDDANEGDSDSLERAIRLTVRNGDRTTQLYLAGVKIRRDGVGNSLFVIDGKEQRLRIPKILDPVSLFSVTLCWDARIARLFAADCAEHVLYIFESDHPDDLRPRKAIEVARAFAHGEATREELSTARAATSAAQAAARTAAWAARAAAYAAGHAAWAAREAAWHAADAAWHAADAARAALAATAKNEAHQTEEAWQKERLLAYLLGNVSSTKKERQWR